MTGPSTEQPESSEPLNLSGMTKAQLLDYAGEHGIEGVDGDMKKADILAAIRGESDA